MMKKTAEQEQETKREPKPVVPRGKAIERTDEELDEMTSAESMEALMGEAAEDYRENAPKAFENLLDGEKA